MLSALFLNLLIPICLSRDCGIYGPGCETCDETSCTSCTALSGFAIDKDPQSSTYRKCHVCVPGCMNCFNSTHCKDCIFGFGPNEKGECVQCEDPECFFCNDDYKICTNCKGKLIADPEESSSTYGKCLECQVNNCKECWGGNPHQCRYCENGFFKTDDSKCEPCIDNCLMCSSSSGCGLCEDGYWYTSEECAKCQIDNCAKCSSSTKCTKCNDGYTIDSNYKCVRCSIDNCVECKDQTHCAVCQPYYGVNSKGQCEKGFLDHCINFTITSEGQDCTACEDGYHTLKKFGQCLEEIENCVSYNADNTCENCNFQSSLDENNICQKCSVANCVSCNNDYKQCYSCDTGYFLDITENTCKNKCFDQNCEDCEDYDHQICVTCKDGYQLTKQSKCIKCNIENCVECNDDGLSCKTCKSGYHARNSKCIKCSGECGKCNDDDDFLDCRMCRTNYGFQLLKGNPNFGKCFQCKDPGCESCNGDPNICLHCQDGYKMIKGLCKEHKEDDGDGDGGNDGNGNGDGNGSHGKGDNKNGGLPLGAIIGIAVGAAVVVIVVVVCVTVFCIKKKRKDISTGEAKEEA